VAEEDHLPDEACIQGEFGRSPSWMRPFSETNATNICGEARRLALVACTGQRRQARATALHSQHYAKRGPFSYAPLDVANRSCPMQRLLRRVQYHSEIPDRDHAGFAPIGIVTSATSPTNVADNSRNVACGFSNRAFRIWFQSAHVTLSSRFENPEKREEGVVTADDKKLGANFRLDCYTRLFGEFAGAVLLRPSLHRR
jgi:hypothetical protein